MIKKELGIICLILILSISFVSAVWYNPFSWFEKKDVSLSSIGASSSCFLGGTTCYAPDAQICSQCSLDDAKKIFTFPLDVDSSRITTPIYAIWTCKDMGGQLKWIFPTSLVDYDGDGVYRGFGLSVDCPDLAHSQDCDDTLNDDPDYAVAGSSSITCPLHPAGCTDDTALVCAICKSEKKDLFYDFDGDGFTSTSGTNVCVGNYLPSWVKLTKNGDDCNEGPDDSDSDCPTSGSCTEEDIAIKNCAYCQNTFYNSLFPDIDKDGSTLGGPIGKCLGASTTSYYKTSASSPEDCDDTNNLINPTLTETCDDKLDNNCNTNSFLGTPIFLGAISPIPQIWDSDSDTGADCQEQACDYSDCKKLIADSVDEFGDSYNRCTDGIGSDLCQCCSGGCKELDRYYEDLDGDGFANKGVYLDVCFESDLPPQTIPAKWIIESIAKENGFDCDDTNNLIHPGTSYYLNPSSADKVCWICNSSGEKEYANLNSESLKNCYVCDDTTQSLKFIENNKMGDDDCFYCDPSSQTAKIDSQVASDISGLCYFIDTSSWDSDNPNSKPTTTLTDQSSLVPSTNYPTCESLPSVANSGNSLKSYYVSSSSRSLFITKGINSGEAKPDCKTCDWKNSGYQFGKSFEEQGKLIDAMEDAIDRGGNCSYCGNDIYGIWGLQADTADSRFIGGTPIPSGGEQYLCKKCALGSTDWVANDNDERVSAYPYDLYALTSCKVCQGGQLKNEGNLALANFCGGATSTTGTAGACESNPLLKPIFDAQRCCGGRRFDDRIEGCCPTSITGNPEVDNFEGMIFSPGVGSTSTKCCKKVTIEANPNSASLMNVVWDYVFAPVGSAVTNYVYAKTALVNLSSYDGKVIYSKTERIVVPSDDIDYCTGEGYGVKKAFGGISEDDKCSPCEPSKKTNYLAVTALSKIGPGLGYVYWLAGLGVAFSYQLHDIDTIIGLRGLPRFNRVCYKSSSQIPLIGLPTGINPGNACGECDPDSKFNVPQKINIKFPTNELGFTIWKNWPRMTNTAQCNSRNIGNTDLSKYASANSSIRYGGVYKCTKDAVCEVQNELIPAWGKYWIKKVIAAYSWYQLAYSTLQLLDVTQGGEIVPTPTTGGPTTGGVDVTSSGTSVDCSGAGSLNTIPANEIIEKNVC